MGRPSNRAERRRQIVRGLMQVMGEHGYDGASTAAIADAAGLSPGLLHYHFANKQAILLALVEELAGRLRERYARLLSEATTPEARLRAFLTAHVAVGPGADPEAIRCWVAIQAEATRRPEVRAVVQRAVSERVDLLTELLGAWLDGQERGASASQQAQAPTRPAEEELRAGAVGLLAAIEGYYLLSRSAPETIPTGSAAQTLQPMLDGLLLRWGAPGARGLT